MEKCQIHWGCLEIFRFSAGIICRDEKMEEKKLKENCSLQSFIRTGHLEAGKMRTKPKFTVNHHYLEPHFQPFINGCLVISNHFPM